MFLQRTRHLFTAFIFFFFTLARTFFPPSKVFPVSFQLSRANFSCYKVKSQLGWGRWLLVETVLFLFDRGTTFLCRGRQVDKNTFTRKSIQGWPGNRHSNTVSFCCHNQNLTTTPSISFLSSSLITLFSYASHFSSSPTIVPLCPMRLAYHFH